MRDPWPGSLQHKPVQERGDVRIACTADYGGGSLLHVLVRGRVLGVSLRRPSALPRARYGGGCVLVTVQIDSRGLGFHCGVGMFSRLT